MRLELQNRESCRFTSKELDEETGLYYYGGRYYEPTSSRWMSADPAGFGLVNPMGSDGKPRAGYSVIESLNWYSYVSNNPVKYTDPTGMEAIGWSWISDYMGIPKMNSSDSTSSSSSSNSSSLVSSSSVSSYRAKHPSYQYASAVIPEFRIPGNKLRETSKFGMRTMKNPITGINETKFHYGKDFGPTEKGDTTQPLLAAADGEVIDIGYVKDGAGHYIVLKHKSGFESKYSHAAKASELAIGDKVRAGDEIGIIGSTGSSTGPHVHIEISQYGKKLDPDWFLE